MSEKTYRAKGLVVYKEPVREKVAGGESVSVGFPVCTVSDYIGEAGAVSVAELLHLGETHQAAPPPSEEEIIAAAIFYGATISLPPPARHSTIIETMDLQIGIPGTNALPALQGFLTSKGRFVNRSEAFGIAYRAGQVTGTSHNTPQLYSEDLW